MDMADLWIDGAVLANAWPVDDRRTAVVVDMDTLPPVTVPPPCILIGIGAGDHVRADAVDVIAEPPVGIAALLRGIAANPDAATVLVHMLRASEGLPPGPALTMESLAYAVLQAGDEFARWLARSRRPRIDPAGRVHVTRTGDEIVMAMDRPQAHNAIDRIMRDALHEAFLVAAVDRDVARVKLRGVGRTFSVGADLAEFGTTTDPVEAHRIRMLTLPAHVIAQCADRLHAHVQGACVGAGLEMAAFAARFTATPDAWFQLPEVGMGLLPGAGGSVSVPRRIGRRRAALMMISGRRIDARTALSWGLVDEIAADDGGANVAGR